MNTVSWFILVYLSGLLYLGFRKRADNDPASFLFAGRKLTLPAFIATLVTTWYGGILEVGRVAYEYGIATWLIFGVFYYFAALIFLYWIAPRISALGIRTIPEFMNKNYGKGAALMAVVFVLLLASPAPYIKMLAVLVKHLYSIPELPALALGATFSMIYAFTGGFGSVVRTDKLQFILMFGGFFLMITVLCLNYGGLEFLVSHTPDYAFKIPGNFTWSYVFIWGFIAMLTFIDPGFYQRCYSGNSPETVKKGILISIGFWILFDALTVFTGIYALAILPELNGNPYIQLAEVALPPLARSLFFVSLLAVIMSTVDSFTFISAYTLGHDLPSILRKGHSEKLSVQLTRMGLLVTGILAVIIAWLFSQVLDIWYTMGTLAVPVLLIPIISAMFKKPVRHPLTVMIFPLLVSSLWLLNGYFHRVDGWPVYPLGIEPMFPGLLTGFLIYRFSRAAG